jgi:hypothetical protein
LHNSAPFFIIQTSPIAIAVKRNPLVFSNYGFELSLGKYQKQSSYQGLVAQLVEQRTENPRVGSSILSQATIKINKLGLLIE